MTAKKPRPGGRSARVRCSVLDAAAAHLVAVGYDRFSVPEVAALADVHQTSIYRRWKTRDALALDACLRLSDQAVPIPDTGAFEPDLVALLEDLRRLLRSPRGAALLALSRSAEPAVAAARDAFWTARFAAVSTVFERAAARGEIAPPEDVGLAIEMLIAPLYLRTLVTGVPLDDLPIVPLARMVATALRRRHDAVAPIA